MPFNDASKNVMLDALDESATQITHIGAFTVTDPGTGTDANVGEVAGGSYARQAVTWGVAASGQKTNTNTISIPIPAGNTVGFLTGYNAAVGNSGNYRCYWPRVGDTAAALRGFGTVDSAGVTSDAIQSAAHGLVNTDRVTVLNVFGAALPTGLVEGTVYFVVQAATNTFEVSLTSGGASVDITGQGQVYWQKLIPEAFAADGLLVVNPGQLVLDLTGV